MNDKEKLFDNIEKPFEYLKRKNGGTFEKEVIRNWYISRYYVLKKLKGIETVDPIMPESNKYLQAVIMGDSAQMLSVARQIALQAHYLNFNEDADDDKARHRTVLSFVTQAPGIIDRLCAEEYLFNLPQYCKYVEYENKPVNEDSYIDMEIHVVKDFPKQAENAIMLVVEEEEVKRFFEMVNDDDNNIFSIDTRKAYYTSQSYRIGEVIDNLPSENIHDVNRYTMALNVYQKTLMKPPKNLFENVGKESEQYQIKEILSNIFCADCFESKANVINELSKGDAKKERMLWGIHNDVLSKCEHARWNVEKLIMGYRPLNREEHYHDEMLHVQFMSKEKQKNYRKRLKCDDNILAHIDLCSYRDLRRIHPENLKYDSFLMLAIPKILKRTGNTGK